MNDNKSAIPNSEGFKLRIRFADGGIADTKVIKDSSGCHRIELTADSTEEGRQYRDIVAWAKN